MNTIEKINLILKKSGISKVNLAKYLGVSRQMVYNYLDCETLEKWPKDKKNMLFKLLEVKSDDEIDNISIDNNYIEKIESKLYYNRKPMTKKEDAIELSGFKKEEQEALNDIFFILKEMLNEDKTKQSLITLNYIYHFLQAMSANKELKYFLGFISKNYGYTKTNVYAYDEDQQYVMESILFSAFSLFNNGGTSRVKLTESHKRWEAKIEQKNEEILSRTQELNTAKVLALKELGYTEINEKNAGEVFDKIAEIQARNSI